MTTKATILKSEARGRRRGLALISLALGAALSAVVALAGTARQAEAVSTEKIVFASNRTTGTGVNNLTGDYEIFRMNPDGTGLRQLTTNKVKDVGPILSPDKTKVAYHSEGVQTSNPQGDLEVYVMNASDGGAKKNLTHNGTDVSDIRPLFTPGGNRIAYTSYGIQGSNPEGDQEVYVMRSLDGTAKKNLTHNGVEVPGSYPVDDFATDFSPTGDKIAYTSWGTQGSNPEGDLEVYLMNALDGSGKKNLTDNDDGNYDNSAVFSPDGKTIAYTSDGVQDANAEGDQEVYLMNATDGSAKMNLSNNGSGVSDILPVFSPGGKRIAYISFGKQDSNLEGDEEIYRMSATDGTDKKNLSNTKDGVHDAFPFFSSDGQKVFYESQGVQDSNPQGDNEIYRMNTLDGTGKKNLSNNGAGVYDGIFPV